jgi:hypothetical protein
MDAFTGSSDIDIINGGKFTPATNSEMVNNDTQFQRSPHREPAFAMSKPWTNFPLKLNCT